jgi:hypothetical protein
MDEELSVESRLDRIEKMLATLLAAWAKFEPLADSLASKAKFVRLGRGGR